jgi:hypothetical protein
LTAVLPSTLLLWPGRTADDGADNGEGAEEGADSSELLPGFTKAAAVKIEHHHHLDCNPNLTRL